MFAIHVYIKPKDAGDDDPIAVEHVFYAKDEAEADKLRLAHLAGCDYYALAEAEGRTAESTEELSDAEAPTWADVLADEEEAEPEEEEETN